MLPLLYTLRFPSPKQGEFEWDPETQGLILGCFFYGYALSHVPGGLLAERYGGKWLMGKSVTSDTVTTALSMVYKGCMIWKTRSIPYLFQNFDSFYPLFPPPKKKYTSLVYFLPY